MPLARIRASRRNLSPLLCKSDDGLESSSCSASGTDSSHSQTLIQVRCPKATASGYILHSGAFEPVSTTAKMLAANIVVSVDTSGTSPIFIRVNKLSKLSMWPKHTHHLRRLAAASRSAVAGKPGLSRLLNCRFMLN